MILPIYIYGHPVLRKVARDIDPDNYSNLKELIDNMFETMYSADGIGLAGPQVGLEERIFVVDLSPLESEEHPEFKDFKKVFINAHISERGGELESTEEGCLSIPGRRGCVKRPEKVTVTYQDIKGRHQEIQADGILARALQHEIDHLNGVLYVDLMEYEVFEEDDEEEDEETAEAGA